MRPLTIPLSLLLLTVAPSPAAGAERGAIVGRVINASTGEPQKGVEVEILGAHRDGERRITRSITTGEDGRYRFADLPAGDTWLYVVDARYGGGLFPGSPVRIPDDTEQRPVLDTTLRVWRTTDDPAAVIVERNDLFVLAGNEGTSVIEAVTIVNPTDLAYVGRRDAGTGDSSSFGFALPSRAGSVRIEDATIDVPELARTDFGFAITSAIPPDRTRITYSYTIAGTAGVADLTRTALYPTADMTVHAEAPFDVEGNRLRPGEDLELEGTTYRTWNLAGRLDAGDPMQIVATARAGFSWGLAAGAAAAIAAFVLLLVVAARRRKAPVARAPEPRAPASREELVSAIAALDIRFDSGELGRDEWEQRRAKLKSQLQDAGVGAP